MNFPISRIIFFLSCLLISIQSFGQERTFSFVENDSEKRIEIRHFSEDKLDVYRNNRAFEYNEAKKQDGAFARAWNRFWRKFFKNLSNGADLKIWYYLAIVVAIVALIWFLLSTQSSSFIAKQNKTNGRYIKELDIRVDQNVLLQKLAEAENNNSYKNAIRFAYLLNLKLLNEKDKIIWKEYKLSLDYLAELNDPSLKEEFSKMTNFFNYGWYGNREISKEMYDEVKTSFMLLQNKIENRL